MTTDPTNIIVVVGAGGEVMYKAPGAEAAGGGWRTRRRAKPVKNQRMTHIAVKRNRQRQMNDYLAVLRIRARIRRSHLYTFACYRPSPTEEDRPHDFNGPGYSRMVYCNQPHMHVQKPLKYCTNYISTTKYNVVSFLPKAIFEQFRRVANLYFLLAAVLSLTPISPFSAVSMIAPLAFVVGLSMAKEALEDWRRFIQDMKVNLRKCNVHKRDGIFGLKPWMKLRVGDIVKVEKDKFFPADLLLLSSSYEDGICYVETMNLDGETNLKVKRSLEITLPLDDDQAFKDFTASIRCEDPNPNLYTFVGNFEYDRQIYPLDPSQILLRDSKLRNTAYVYGVVIFTGHDSKVMQNSTKSPSKRSRIEKQMDKIIYILFSLLVFISFISSVGFIAKTKIDLPNWWYLQVPDEESLYDPSKPLTSGFYHLITALILYGYLIPISLYVSIEVVKVLQALFINKDIHMYDEETGTPAQARTSNLNEELGQVDTILSDKTGTLTCNQMDFLKCSIAGTAYGMRASDVELAAAKQMAMDIDGQSQVSTPHAWRKSGFGENEIELEAVISSGGGEGRKSIKGFSFDDSRLMNGNWFREPNPDMILLFFRILAVCHTAIPEENEETGVLTYEAESPDEGAFLVAAREFGFEFCRRTQSSIFVRERYPSYQEPVEREFKVLNLLDFTSKRKRMSVIVRDETGQILLFCKGADSIIFDRLARNGRMYEEATTKHLNEYGEAGLRTLALAYKKLDEVKYAAWNEEFSRARTSINGDREAMLERISDAMERDLILVGATAVEDKLQNGLVISPGGTKYWIPQCEDSIRPHKGQVFRTLGEAADFYRAYASVVGFDIRQSTLVKAKDNTVLWRYLVCSREGYKHHSNTGQRIPSDSRVIRRRVSNRVGCNARIQLRVYGVEGYVVKFFEERHNHTMTPEECRAHLKINRTMTAAHQGFVLNCIKANIGPTKSFKLYKEMVGGYAHIGATNADFKNFKRELLAHILGVDAQMVIDKFYKRQDNSSAFYFQYELDEKERLRRIFWADPISRRNYCSFGDVVSFDATYSTN
ncbi:Putative phospholipid-transporting ATPase 4, partial [Striga hermonthica]